MNNNKLVEVYRDTQTKCRTGKFSKLDICESIMYNTGSPVLNELTFLPKYKTNIKVVNGLVLDVTQNLYDSGETNILVLNLASSFCPGGGVVKGSIAQEEDLFRKTNYFLSLPMKFYPIPRASEYILTRYL